MITNLAYVMFRSPAYADWTSFGPDIVGAELVDGEQSDGSVRLRIDERPWRISIGPGDHDDLDTIGWDVAPDQFDATVADIAALGIVVAESADLAADRQADRLAFFDDPFGCRHEVVTGIQEQPFTPSTILNGGFVTGGQGMGHIVLMVPDMATAVAFVTDGLGMQLSDTIEIGSTIRFFHCPGDAARHHSIALSEVPGRRGVHHIMLEYADPDDVGRAFDRVRDAGHALSMDYGRHPNDLVSSFYVRTPSGFDLELGTGGVTIDDEDWTTAHYDSMSLWGHRPPAEGPLRPGILVRVEAPIQT